MRAGVADRPRLTAKQSCRTALTVFVLFITPSGCQERGATVGTPAEGDAGADEQVTTLGSAEVSARLIEIPGKLLDDPLYNHAFIFKYEVVTVHRGQIEAKQIAVAQYNPARPRSDASDEFNPQIGGGLRRFRAGYVHRMALEMPLDDHYIGPIVDRYHEEEKGPVYWALWTNGVGS